VSRGTSRNVPRLLGRGRAATASGRSPSRGADQEECAQHLRSEFGLGSATEPQLSRWESGRIQRPKCVEELRAFIETQLPGALGTAEADPRSSAEQEADAPFQRLMEQLADEPLLGPLQAEFVSAISTRLRSGPRMSSEDRATYLDQARILRLLPRH
jgi:hypothetical protein